jgi:hypothetical protein
MSKIDALTAVTSRAATDREFRNRLLTNAPAAVEEATGHKLPSNSRVKFIEGDPSYDATIVLPDFVSDEALSANELEAVAGGATMAADWCVATCNSTVISA